MRIHQRDSTELGAHQSLYRSQGASNADRAFHTS
jgi:hypothetical protein